MGAATGRVDALVFMAGLVAGILVFAEMYPALAGFLWSSDLGRMTLAELLGLPFLVLALAVVAMALGTFWLIARFASDGVRGR